MGAINVLNEPNQNFSRNGMFIARALAKARPSVHVRIMNVTNQDKVLSEDTTIGHGVSAM